MALSVPCEPMAKGPTFQRPFVHHFTKTYISYAPWCTIPNKKVHNVPYGAQMP